MPRWSPPLLPAASAVAALFALGGCEPMAPSGNPFAPVKVQAVATGPAAAPAADPRFADFDEEPQSFSSEELAAMAGGTAADPAAAPAAGGADSAPAAPTTPAAPTAAQVGADLAVQAPAVINPAAPLGWAVRLVSTVPMAQPPRAILGLPDGREVVVTPGAMVPEVGLVVLAIGAQSVQLARVQATGDHATVDAIQLSPLY
ncbi:hypothetical protein L6R53_20290 [Myxococcota bacterium]|nr:hypothetical protein [Myxococcota bacterium]